MQAISVLQRRIKAKYIIRFAAYVLLIDLSFVFLYPFLYMVVTSLKSPQDILDVSVNWLPSGVYLNNYKLAFETLNYPLTLLRTVLFVLACTAGHILSCSFVGYGFARFKFTGKNLLFILLLLSIIVPIQTIIIPQYILFAKTGLLRPYLPMVLPSWLGFGLSGGLFVFIFRQFYLTLPRSLEEAAAIDGCGIIPTFFRIAFPSSKSPIMVCLVLSLVWHWNDYFEPLIYITRKEHYLLPMLLPGIYSLMFRKEQDIPGQELNNMFTESVVLAATFMVVLPLLVTYIFLQKKFVQGVERSGITGE